GNPWIGELDPFLAGAHAVGEAVRNVVATGAVPIAATDCLNYGNPEKADVFWQFRRGVEGIAAACKELGLEGEEPLPIVSGNVSFYNQSSNGGAIPPSPIVAVFGRINDFTRSTDISLKVPGNLIILVGNRRDELGGSLFYRVCIEHRGGRVPAFRGKLEREMARFVLECCEAGISRSVHDISEGGIILAAAEMAIASRTDARRGIIFDSEAMDPVFLYSETPGYLIEMSQESWDAIESKPEFLAVVGRVTDDFCIASSEWRMDLQDILEDHVNRLDRIIWREEITE
ncbi:MAG: hypothetical protein K8S24_11025, partial [Candidatus Aegiribacteria sp.]|nr:hypothetical protein [Candidatus Aegiribacteria sp.]